MGWWMTSQFPSKRWLTSLSYTSPFFTLEQDIVWYVISPSVVQVMCLVVFPPSLLHTLPSGYGVGKEWETEEAWTACKHLSATAKTEVCYWLCFSHKSKAQDHVTCYEENSLHMEYQKSCHGHGNKELLALVRSELDSSMFHVIPSSSHTMGN